MNSITTVLTRHTQLRIIDGQGFLLQSHVLLNLLPNQPRLLSDRGDLRLCCGHGSTASLEQATKRIALFIEVGHYFLAAALGHLRLLLFVRSLRRKNALLSILFCGLGALSLFVTSFLNHLARALLTLSIVNII